MRKGIVFSIIIFFIASTVVALIILQRSLVSHRREELAIEERVNSMKNLHESILRDLEKATEIITRRAIVAATSYVISNGKGLDDAPLRLKELLLNGTLNQTPESLMQNNTLPVWIEKIENVSKLKGFDVNLTLLSLSVEPYDSWDLLVSTKLSINITDEHKIASLIRNEKIDTLVYLEDLEDPVYPLYTGGVAANTIRRTQFKNNFTQLLLTGNGNNGWVYAEATNNTADENGKILIIHNASGVPLDGAKGVISEVNFPDPGIPYLVNSSALNLISSGINILLDGNNKTWFIDNLKNHVENSYYYSSNDGPSFLDRLEGKLTCDYCSLTSNTIGLESFVNKDEFISLSLPVDLNKTNVDYLYFNSSYSSTVCKVKGLSSTFRIDPQHEITYNVTHLVYDCT